MQTNDREIRFALHNILVKQYLKEPNTLYLHEWKICQGEARIDIAVINGTINGYEIKSDKDTLERFSKQIVVYNRVFDLITVVTGISHIEDVISMVPEYWGIIAATSNSSGVNFSYVRYARQNNYIEPFSLAQFLWKEELIELFEKNGLSRGILFEKNGLSRGIKKMPRFKLWSLASETFSTEQLKEYVKLCLMKRDNNWRPDALRT